jgi:hypothetical protein
MRTDAPSHSALVTRVGRFFLLASCGLIAITISQLMVLLSPTAPPQARPTHYAGIQETLMFLAALLLLYALTLSVSFALLKRISWARPAFIGILALGIVLNLARLVFNTLVAGETELPTEGPAPYLAILRASSVLDVLVPVGLIAGFAWLIVKLNSATVRAEFERG